MVMISEQNFSKNVESTFGLHMLNAHHLIHPVHNFLNLDVIQHFYKMVMYSNNFTILNCKFIDTLDMSCRDFMSNMFIVWHSHTCFSDTSKEESC